MTFFHYKGNPRASWRTRPLDRSIMLKCSSLALILVRSNSFISSALEESLLLIPFKILFSQLGFVVTEILRMRVWVVIQSIWPRACPKFQLSFISALEWQFLRTPHDLLHSLIQINPQVTWHPLLWLFHKRDGWRQITNGSELITNNVLIWGELNRSFMLLQPTPRIPLRVIKTSAKLLMPIRRRKIAHPASAFKTLNKLPVASRTVVIARSLDHPWNAF